MNRCLGLALCALAATASVCAAETRVATDDERASFHTYYLQQKGNAAPAGATVNAVREGAAGAWRLEALVDAPARRALRTLCRMERTAFIREKQWQSAQTRQFAWSTAASCAEPAHPVALGQRMPDTDILALIEQQGALLARARLLFAGNTACAVQRAYNYRLVAIDVSVFISGSEEMATLTYRSDRGPTARVWARRTGLAYDPWNVSCP